MNVAEFKEKMGKLDSLSSEFEDVKNRLNAHIDERLERQRRKIWHANHPPIDSDRAYHFGLGAREARSHRVFEDAEHAQDFAAICKALGGREIPNWQGRALEPGGSGDYLVPEEISAEIWKSANAGGLVRRIARRVPLGKGVTKFPRGLTSVTVGAVAAGQEISDSTPTFGQLAMEGNKQGGLCVVDSEMLEDPTADLGNYLGTEFSDATVRREDYLGLKGTGAPVDSGITGILNSDRVTVVTMSSGTGFSNLSLDHLIDTEAAVASSARANARWIMHRSIVAVVKKLKDENNNPLWQPAVGGEPATLIGYPVEVSDQMPSISDTAASTKFIAFGDFRKGLYFGVRRDMRIDRSDQRYFTTDQVGFRLLERIDIAVNGYTTAELAANTALANPIAVLQTAAA